jgi:teichoic acid transport system ATP-binding protein
MGHEPDASATRVHTHPVSGDVAISVQDLHVSFRVYTDSLPTTRRLLTQRKSGRTVTEVHAVQGVSLEVRAGDVVGIVGSNGSGKSTLLGAIAGLLPPRSGSVLVRSEPVLLGVGAALKPELSGYRNIIIGCLAMGLPMGVIKERIDSVAEFTALGDALNRPLRTYSSGMRARLAFAIATLEHPDILLIDEALAVGDRSFRKKSLARLRSLQHDASAVVMVTHNMNEIRSTCTRAVWLEGGRLVIDGTVEEVLDAYEAKEPDLE